MRRGVFIEKEIRNQFKEEFSKISSAFDLACDVQVRNSIAHSNYSFMNRNIHLNNVNGNSSKSQIHELSFDEWINNFHYTMIFQFPVIVSS